MNPEKRAEFSEEDDADNIDQSDNEYFAKVKSLNESFLKWIQEYMVKSPYYIFTPVCKEYMQYIDSLDKEYGKKVPGKRGRPKRKIDTPVIAKVNDKQVNNVEETNSSSQPTSSSQEVSSATSSQNSTTFVCSTSAPSTSTNSIFGVDSKRTKLDAESKNVIGPDFFSMSQSTAKINSETVSQENKNDETMATGEDEPYQPPKPQSLVIEEHDCVYSKRCKLFYKKDANFVERGLGILYVKKPDSGKYQLLIRADTTLGNILLNIQLHPSLPLSVSKKGVLLTCIPNPPISSKANDQSTVCFFIKVRNESDANDLLKNLNEYSGK